MGEILDMSLEFPQEGSKYDVFIAKVNELVAGLPEGAKAQIIEEAKTYKDKMDEVTNPEEAAQRLVMSRRTTGHIVE